MPRPSKRERLLDAAAVVSGQAGRFTLDRVAEQAGVSKGGLLYHFPDRRCLLIALVERHTAAFSASISHPDDREWARRYLTATLAGTQIGSSTALLAVAAEDLSLLEPLRERMLACHARARKHTGLLNLFLAADGLWYARLFGLPTPELDLLGDLEVVFD